MNSSLKNELVELASNSLSALQDHKKMFIYLELPVEVPLIDNLIENINKFINTLLSEIYEIKDNYLSSLHRKFESFIKSLPYPNIVSMDDFRASKKPHLQNIYKQRLLSFLPNMKNVLSILLFELIFFSELEYFSGNIVVIGANGSGKTRLASKIKTHLGGHCVLISAQRILFVSRKLQLSDVDRVGSRLRSIQNANKSGFDPEEIDILKSEFDVILSFLIFHHISFLSSFRESNQEQLTTNSSLLEKVIHIWNSYMTQRILKIEHGYEVLVYDNDQNYSLADMSDGEKVAFFLIAQVLLAPNEGFVIVDEPELSLHKTILKSIWNHLEEERKDCIFIYLTHDLDFTISRTLAKKIWLKKYHSSFKFWDIKNISLEEVPDSLVLELLGSRKNVLFCEGEKGSLDERIYSRLFSKFLIVPVGSCFNVIYYTKALNALNDLSVRAYGIIDSDHHPDDRIRSLHQDNIFAIEISEIENILLDRDFLSSFAFKIFAEQNCIQIIIDGILKKLNDSKTIQAARYVSEKINYYYSDTDFNSAQSIEDLNDNLARFNDAIKINDWYTERLQEIEKIYNDQNYNAAIRIINDKGLVQIVNSAMKIKNFHERALVFLNSDDAAKNHLLKYFSLFLSQLTSLD